jgi:hypothetical protein
LIALYENLISNTLRSLVDSLQVDVAVSEGEESLTHYTGKAVAVEALKDQAQTLETEKKLDNITVDVYLTTTKGKRIAVEVETFYKRPLITRRLVEFTLSKTKQPIYRRAMDPNTTTTSTPTSRAPQNIHKLGKTEQPRKTRKTTNIRSGNAHKTERLYCNID